jgi:hypothetical protein
MAVGKLVEIVLVAPVALDIAIVGPPPHPLRSTRTPSTTASSAASGVSAASTRRGPAPPICAGSGRCTLRASQGACASQTKWRRWSRPRPSSRRVGSSGRRGRGWRRRPRRAPAARAGRPPVTLAQPARPPAPPPLRRATPLRLTDEQMDMIMQAAAPLALPDRGPFLEAVAAALQGHELGDGLVARVCAEQQRRWFSPPADERHGAQWDRALR